MAEKILNSRIIQKHDSAENWDKAVNFIPKLGEIIVYDKDDKGNDQSRIKIGDGVTNVKELSFAVSTISSARIDEICGISASAQPLSVNEEGDATLAFYAEIDGEGNLRV